MIHRFKIIAIFFLINSLLKGQSTIWPVSPNKSLIFDGGSAFVIDDSNRNIVVKHNYNVGKYISTGRFIKNHLGKLFPQNEIGILSFSKIAIDSEKDEVLIFYSKSYWENGERNLNIIRYSLITENLISDSEIEITRSQVGHDLELIPHPCGGFWVIVHGISDDLYHAYRIFSDFERIEGPISSKIGLNRAIYPGIRKMRYSYQKNLLFVSSPTSDIPFVECFRFDTFSGQITSLFNIPYDQSKAGYMALSPDESMLYLYEKSIDSSYIYQYDITSLDSISIVKTKKLVDKRIGTGTYDIQLGPDDRIYIVHDHHHISVINQPNRQLEQIDFEYGVYQSESTALFTHLPNHKAIKSDPPNKNTIDQLPSDTTLCRETYWDVKDLPSGDIFINDMPILDQSFALATGVHKIEINDDLCIYQDSIAVTYEEYDLNIDTTTCPNTPLQLNLADFAISTTWSDGSTDLLRTLSVGTYVLSATTADGCTITDTITISEDPDCPPDIADCHTYLPNAISTVSTRDNEAFYPQSSCPLHDYQMSIYDRWGGRVYYSSDPTQRWDGRSTDQAVMPGVYSYITHYRYAPDSDIIRHSGTVTVIR